MGLYNEYVKNISKNDVKHAASYKVHASYIFLSIVVTWFLSLTSTFLTTLFIAFIFITIVNVAKTDSYKQDINVMLSKFENDSGSDEESVEEQLVNESTTTKLNSNTLPNSVFENDSDEIVVDQVEKKSN